MTMDAQRPTRIAELQHQWDEVMLMFEESVHLLQLLDKDISGMIKQFNFFKQNPHIALITENVLNMDFVMRKIQMHQNNRARLYDHCSRMREKLYEISKLDELMGSEE